jgi:mannose/fructose/N-acetylgalactosamine-specific phosphotransferase system component IID
MPTEEQKKRQSWWFGLILMLVGIWMVWSGAEAYQTGAVMVTYRHGSWEWWEQVGIGVGAILIGALSADWIKIKPKP